MTEENKEFQLAVRIAVAESRLDSHAQQIENNQEMTAKIVDRMDLHIREQGARDIEITNVINDCRLAITEWKSSADTFIQTANAFMKTGIKILAGFALIVSAIWAVFLFYVDHSGLPANVTVEQKK
jgi:hypothetical protein